MKNLYFKPHVLCMLMFYSVISLFFLIECKQVADESLHYRDMCVGGHSLECPPHSCHLIRANVLKNILESSDHTFTGNFSMNCFPDKLVFVSRFSAANSLFSYIKGLINVLKVIRSHSF